MCRAGTDERFVGHVIHSIVINGIQGKRDSPDDDSEIFVIASSTVH